MRSAIARALIFAGASLAVTLAIDTVMTLVYQRGPGEGGARQFLAFRTALHGATFAMSLLGAALGFAAYAPTRLANAHVALLGAGFGTFALAASLTGVRLGGFAVIAVVIVGGAAAVAYFGAKAIAAAGD